MTDLCVMEPDDETKEFMVSSIHRGVSREQIVDATGWAVRFVPHVVETEPPNSEEISTLRDLHARTAKAHGTSKSEAA